MQEIMINGLKHNIHLQDPLVKILLLTLLSIYVYVIHLLVYSVATKCTLEAYV